MAKLSATFWQNCATCDSWRGPRQADGSARTVRIDPQARGARQLKSKYPVRYATNVCAGWKQWAALGAATAAAVAPWHAL